MATLRSTSEYYNRKHNNSKMKNYVDSPFESPVILSLCPGVLGLERGLERAIGPVRVAAYVEIESFIIANLVAAMEQGVLAPAPIWSDIKTFNGSILRNKIHGIIGGYPCQPFSASGVRKGTDDPRHLYPYISGIIKAARPIWCFFENVDGHLSLGYPEVSTDLRSMGYSVEAGIYSAEEAGAPHQRDRLFILAICPPTLGVDQVNSESWWTGGLRDSVGQRERHGIAGSGGVVDEKQILAHPDGYGGWENSERCELRATRAIKSPCDSRIPRQAENGEKRLDGWPSRPGYQQQGWEEPYVESKMGSTIDGYNFREDFLRALGNSVVEQTAEIAFLDLLNKHINNRSK